MPQRNPERSHELTTTDGRSSDARPTESVEIRGDRLIFQRVLAQGGMGSIVQVYDPHLQRHVALKVMHRHVARTPGQFAAFVSEARITAHLDHPSIVPVYDLYLDERETWAGFTMKIVNGESLERRLKDVGDERLSPATLRWLLEVLIKVCDAVSFAHAHQRLHLDLKPGNVMIGVHGEVYVMDWGIALKCQHDAEGHLRPTEPYLAVCGTPAYMAPEQWGASHSDVDERTDVYGLGGILYEALTGRPPGAAPATGAPETDELALRPPPALLEVARRALASDPRERQASVDEFKADIERLRYGGAWLQPRTFRAGENILVEGEHGIEAFILASGHCRVFKDGTEGQRLIRILKPGDLFGEMAILTDGRRTASVVAESDVEVWVVTQETLMRELGQHAWMGALVRGLCERFREADEEREALRAELAQRQRRPL